MHYPRIITALALSLLTFGCADSPDPTAPLDVSYARGGIPGAPARPDKAALLTDIAVSGVLENGSSFAGTLSITGLSRDGEQLLASGVLTYDNAGTTVTQTFTDVPASLTGASSSSVSGGPNTSASAVCDILFLDLGPIFLDVLGLTVDLSQIVLDIDAVSGAGNLLGNLLCAVTGLLDGPGIIASIGQLLDQINDILDDIGGILAGVTGSVAGATGFAGDVTIESIERTAGGALEVTGVLNGAVTLLDGTTVQVVDQAFTTTATLTGGGPGGAAGMDGMAMGSSAACDVLLLDLGPIFLDLLGLEVDLSQVVLDIDAVAGAGNLLGNLLCAVTGLLDGFSLLDSLLDRINRILDLF